MKNCIEDHHHHHDHDMPEDVLIEVLTRLPVKSLLRFRCICKHWYAIILNPTFEHHHLNRQKSDNKGRLLIQRYKKHTYQYGYALLLDETLATISYHDLDYLQGRGTREIDGPINGLFCLFNCMDRFIIWNPAMREFKLLPIPYHPKRLPHFSPGSWSVGFGLDQITNDSKVVLIRQFCNDRTDYVEGDACVNVYTLSTNTWRHLDGLDYLSSKYLRAYSGTGAYLDGIYYWIIPYRSILTFDMGKEVFGVILGPDTHEHPVLLTLYDNHLAWCCLRYVTESRIDRCIDIWVMELKGSWIKQFTIGPLPRIEWPLGFWNNYEFLFVISDSPKIYCNAQVVLYDFTTQEFRDIGPKGDKDHFSACIYYESLASVKGGMHQRKGKLLDSAEAK
ncbi:putative F-box protein At3g10240 [Actinidia eriantha]|uniref:putative F-box protein At3g10240 n=1 Tax=Actinidia eriantha TaxID=165200 RepID=UPI00258FF332|nr:putative F-box protein At3g10240 [Actinidia eriantha]